MKKIVKTVAILLVVGGAICAVFPGVLMVPLMLFGGYTGLRSDLSLLEAHQRAVNSFTESKGFGISRMRHESLWNEYLVNLDGETFDPESIHLIGLTEEFGDRYFGDRYPPKKELLTEIESRGPTPEESEAISDLREGAALSRRISNLPKIGTDGGSFRILAPIIAGSTCLKCHEVEDGDLLGAFAYTLIPRQVSEVTGLGDSPQTEIPEPRFDPSSIPRPGPGR